MVQAEPRELVLKKLHGLGSIHQAGIGREAAPVIESPQDVQAEAMEGSDAECCGVLRPFQRDPLGHLSRSLVREGQEEYPSGIYAFVEQAFDASYQRARLSCAWPRLK